MSDQLTIVYARQWPVRFLDRPSIFLAGPTPRDKDTPSWRPDAILELRRIGFRGYVFVPEDETGDWSRLTYMDQVRWEWDALDAATAILFWIPRNILTMPAFTTNVEFGMYWNSGKAVVGAPADAAKNDYLIALAKRANLEWYSFLTLAAAEAARMAETRWEAGNR